MAEPFPYARYFGDIRLLADLQLKPGEKLYDERPASAARSKEFLLYLGCNVLRTAHLAQTAVAVLRAMGFDFDAVGGPAYCCGIVHYMHGERASAKSYAGSTLRHFAGYAAQKVVMWCPSCTEHFDDVVTKQHEVPFPYEHMTALLARHLDRIHFVRPVKRTVTLHYHTGHPQQDRDRVSARQILERIPGLDFREIPNPGALGRHCSPAYIGRIGAEAWRAHVRSVLDAALAAGADTLATIYHSCHREICDAEGRYPLKIVNYVTLLGEAMGIEYPDRYKEWRLLGRPDEVFETLRPYVEVNRLDPAKVRDLIARTFSPACEQEGGPS